MSRNTLSAIGIASLFLLGPGLSSQDETAPEAPVEAAPQKLLDKAIKTMAQMPGITFKTLETQDSATTRRFARQMGNMGGAFGGGGRDTEVRGAWSDGILQAFLGDGEDEILSYRGRMIARNDDISWKLRRDRLAAGGKMPFVLDPSRFFEALQSLAASARRTTNSKTSTYRDKEVLIVGITLEDEDAQDFALAGSLPAMSGGMGGAIVIMGGGGARMGGGALPELTVDIAFYVEPATGYIHKVRTRCYQKGRGGGNFRIQVQGGGQFGQDEEEEEEEDEVEERDEKGKRIYKRGLPVRKLPADISKMNYDIIFSKHAHPVPMKIDVLARKLLHLGEAKGGKQGDK